MSVALRAAVRGALAAALGAGLLIWAPNPAIVRAAAPDLTISSDARYDVQPDQQRVRITLNLLLTNHLKDTVTRRFYFDRAFLAVLPNTSSFKLSWAGKGTPSVRVSKRTKDYTLVTLDLAQRLFSGKTARYTLRFDLVDPGGAPTRDVRVGSSLVSLIAAAIARELGGRSYAQVLAALALGLAPLSLAVGHFFSLNVFDLLFWSLATLLALRAFETDSWITWGALGLTLGLGLLNKWSVF